MRTWVGLLSLSFLTVAVAGCASDPAIDCTVPTEAIVGFQVTVTTGRDATDADIFFCIERLSNPSRDCEMLGTTGVDDWDVGSIGNYAVSRSVDANDLAAVAIENRGDAPGLSFDGNDWELDGVRVVAQTASGTGVLVFEAEGLRHHMDAGDRWEPNCVF